MRANSIFAKLERNKVSANQIHLANAMSFATATGLTDKGGTLRYAAFEMSAINFLLATCLFCGCAALARAQTAPVPPPTATTGQPTTPIVSEESKQTPVPTERDNAQERMRTGRGVRDPGAKPTLDIRLRDGGVKMPKCAEESREGEACK